MGIQNRMLRCKPDACQHKNGRPSISHHPAGSQTCNALGLYLEMCPESKKKDIFKSLLGNIQSEKDYHLDTGIVGTRYMFDVLADYGEIETAFRVATQESYPGWGYMMQNDATTLWERWEKLTGGAMNSHNHIMLGSIDAWFYRYLAGIRILEPGWRKILIAPGFLEKLEYVSATHFSVKGRIQVDWERNKSFIMLNVSIPANTKGIVRLRAKAILENNKAIWKNNKPAGKALGIQSIKRSGKNNDIDIYIGSGDYSFTIYQ